MDSDWNDTSFFELSNFTSANGGQGGDAFDLPTDGVQDDIVDVEPYLNFLNGSRFWIQRVLVPIIVFVGVLGNVATVAVLTRRRMRSSTNVYLTALAASDLLYLVFVFSLSLEHYPKLPEPYHQFYWQYRRFGLWLTDAASSTSVWLTVSFTVERYIAVCHPMRGKMLCTESRARRVTALVYALCFLATATTPFEWETDIVPVVTAPQKGAQATDVKSFANSTEYESDAFLLEVFFNVTDIPLVLESHSNLSLSEAPFNVVAEPTEQPMMKYVFRLSKLGRDETYRAVFYWFTSVTFVFLPLILLFVFNSFLIHAVHTSRKQRFKMTQSRKGEQSESSQSQENKITITLIAVVILFVVCQLPTASILIYASFAPAPSRGNDALLRGLGNIFNFLVTINAASNFLLYCALSGKYRRTFVRTFAPCWAKRWRYFQSTRRRTSVRERSGSEGSSGALVRKRGRRKGGRGGGAVMRGGDKGGGIKGRESTDSYYLTTNNIDDSQCRGSGASPRASSPGSSSMRLVPANPSGAPDLLSVPAADDRNGGIQPRLKRHSSAYVSRDNQVSRPTTEFFRTRSMGSRGKRPSCPTSSATSSSSIPAVSASTTTPSSSITREDSALLVEETGRSPTPAITSAVGRNGSAANGGSATPIRQTGMLSRIRRLRRRLWKSSEIGASSSAAAVRITVTDEEAEGGARTTV